MSKEELLKYLIAEIDLIMHDKDYRFENCTFFDLKDCDGKYSNITVAPQSYCYVKELEEK